MRNSTYYFWNDEWNQTTTPKDGEVKKSARRLYASCVCGSCDFVSISNKVVCLQCKSEPIKVYG